MWTICVPHARPIRRQGFQATAPAPSRAGPHRCFPRLTDNAYDLVFIDADKPSFVLYAEQAVRLLKPGGLLIINGALDNGRVADPAAREPLTATMRQVGRLIRDNDRLVSALLPTGDGLQLAVKTASGR